MCVVRDAPCAFALTYEPLWQVEHATLVAALWFIRADVQFVVLWQFSQAIAAVGIWVSDRPGARPPAPTWQVAQVRGVPRNVPAVWQDSQDTVRWALSRMNPVVLWSKFRLCDEPSCPACPNTSPDTPTRTMAAASKAKRIRRTEFNRPPTLIGYRLGQRPRHDLSSPRFCNKLQKPIQPSAVRGNLSHKFFTD